MYDETQWNTIFWALAWVGVSIIVVFYMFPTLFESKTPNTLKHSPLFVIFFVYLIIWILMLTFKRFDTEKKHAEIKGLWRLKPNYAGTSEMFDPTTSLMIPATGMVDLLISKDAKKYIAETFTFACFISVNHSSIEGITGDSLKQNFKPYQLVVSIPGAYDIFIDPFHEMLLFEFKSYETASYKVQVPNFRVNRWNQLLISLEGRTADIYVNGILLKSIGLLNVIYSTPGTPKVNMNPYMYCDVALVQVWPIRLKEPDIIANYKWNADSQGVPPIPLTINNFLQIPTCTGTDCPDSISSSTNGITYVNYEYA
jgi:hypothetical protein